MSEGVEVLRNWRAERPTSHTMDVTGSRYVMWMRLASWFVVLAGVGTTSNAHAYRTAADVLDVDERVAQRSRHVAFYVHDSLASRSDLDSIEAAMRTWSSQPCAQLQLAVGVVGTEVAMPEDEVNTIQWVDVGWTELGFEANAAATTDVRYVRDSSGWLIAEADIYLNAELFEWGSDGLELRSVLLHELGHAIGVAHPCELSGEPVCSGTDQLSAVFPTYGDVGVLSDDDVMAVCSLYPPPACSDCECNADWECPSGRCVDGSCLSSGVQGDPCTSTDDCAGLECLADGYCSESCTITCPTGYACEGGTCRSELGAFGDSCGSASDCASSICLSHGAEAMCSRACRGGCPPSYECAELDFRDVCAPASNGCSASGGSPAAWLWVVFLGLRRLRS